MHDINAKSSAVTVPLSAAQPPFVFTLDVGTSSVRAQIYDSQARAVENLFARLTYKFHTTAEGGAERDADELLADVITTISGVCARAGNLINRVEMLAISCFWHSLVGTDAGGHAVTPLYGWADTRAGVDAEELRATLDEQSAHGRTGCRFHASYWTAKIRWLHRTAPESTGAVVRWLGFAEYLTQHLCNEAAASISMASATGLFDTHRLAWDEELAAACGVSPEQLPSLAPSDCEWRIKQERLASWTGGELLRDAVVLPPIGDGAANNLGENCTNSSRIAVMVGTSAAMRVISESAPPVELPLSLWCYRLDRRRIVIGGALSDGGGLRQWLAETLRLSGDATSVEQQLAALPPDAHGLTILPLWSGERSTGWSPDARGAILGLTPDVLPIELLRAGMEAVAYRLAAIADALAVSGVQEKSVRFIASGGAMHASPVWAQMLADVLGANVEVSEVAEASSRGAAMLALEHTGKLQAVAKNDGGGIVYEPDRTCGAIYARARSRQQATYDLIIANRDFARLINRRTPLA